MRHADRRHLATLCAAPEARQAGRPRHLTGRHFEGAARAGGAAKGRRLAADREVDALCDAERRRTWNYLEEYRYRDQIQETGYHALCRHRRRIWRGTWPHQRLGG